MSLTGTTLLLKSDAMPDYDMKELKVLAYIGLAAVVCAVVAGLIYLFTKLF